MSGCVTLNQPARGSKVSKIHPLSRLCKISHQSMTMPLVWMKIYKWLNVLCSPSSYSKSSICDTPWSPPRSSASSSCPLIQSPVDMPQKCCFNNCILNNVQLEKDPRFYFSHSLQASDVNRPPSPPAVWQTHKLGSSSSPHLKTAEQRQHSQQICICLKRKHFIQCFLNECFGLFNCSFMLSPLAVLLI